MTFSDFLKEIELIELPIGMPMIKCLCREIINGNLILNRFQWHATNPQIISCGSLVVAEIHNIALLFLTRMDLRLCILIDANRQKSSLFSTF